MITVAVCSLIVGIGIGCLISSQHHAAVNRAHITRIRELELKFSRLRSLIRQKRELDSLKKEVNHANSTKF